MSRDRLLVIDADLPKRLVSQLKNRSRNAISAAELGLSRNVQDPALLRGLAENYNGKGAWILVTGDDAMPAEHGDVILETAATIATIHPDYPVEMTEYAWRIDLVQRWAHAMQEQKLQTVRRYAMNGSQVWKPRRRHAREAALHGWKPWHPSNAAIARQPGSDEAAGPVRPQPDRLPGFE